MSLIVKPVILGREPKRHTSLVLIATSALWFCHWVTSPSTSSLKVESLTTELFVGICGVPPCGEKSLVEYSILLTRPLGQEFWRSKVFNWYKLLFTKVGCDILSILFFISLTKLILIFVEWSDPKFTYLPEAVGFWYHSKMILLLLRMILVSRKGTPPSTSLSTVNLMCSLKVLKVYRISSILWVGNTRIKSSTNLFMKIKLNENFVMHMSKR